LAAHRAGDGSALERAFVLVYSELRRLAHRQLGGGSMPTLNTTGLVNELYLKLVDRSNTYPNDRGHFMAIASRAMRQIIIDYARDRATRKRGGGVRHVSLDKAQISVADQAGELLEIDRAMGALADVDARLVRIVECRFFAGLTEEETAEALDISLRTVQRDWKRAKAWLLRFMHDD
jgi:RNA polymerase sigma factor (TIGR02999 family)